MTGPVQVLVVGFEHPDFTGEVMAELARLTGAGIVRVVDVLLVTRTEDGTFETLPAPPGFPPGAGELAARILGGPDDVAVPTPVEEHQWSLADAVAAGTSAAVALIEHRWAEPLREAIYRAGGTPLDETWLSPEDVDRVTALVQDHGRS
jgi:Family of unknown function (DUF6325)